MSKLPNLVIRGVHDGPADAGSSADARGKDGGGDVNDKTDAVGRAGVLHRGADVVDLVLKLRPPGHA